MGKVVGIDLGTTNSVVAVMEGGKPVVIANAEGMRTTPSVVGFSKDGERLVGQMARRQTELNPQNTFYGVKRFMGRKYGELSPKSKQVPFTIRKDDDGNVKIKCPKQNREYAPEEISAMILQKLADEASRYLGEAVTGAVITVPAYFNDSQRQATKNAGKIAGLDVLRILNEPTAASLAYGLDKRQSEMILVFDLGGGTFDVSVLEVGDGVFQVKSTSGDVQLGGMDFDRKIVDWLAEEFLAAENIDLRKERQSLQRLTEAAEKAKIELSGVMVTDINLPFITATAEGPKHIETRLSRAQFEDLCADLIARLRGPVKRAMSDAQLSAYDVDEVVLVGGSTRIPAVQELVRSFINKRPNQNVNPDEVVAVGAAIQAGVLAGEVKDILLLDVTPLSLGLETIGGVMKKLIPRNTTIPVRKSDIFSTSENNQTMVEVHVVQGEREMAADNKSLGRFKLTGIPPAPKGIPQVQVSLDVDANGILQVTAMDRTTGREQTVTIQGASTLGELEVKRMIDEAAQYAASDKQKREKVDKRNRAEALTYQAERQLREVALEFGMQFANAQRKQIEGLIRELREALADNDERLVDEVKSELDDALYDFSRQVRMLTEEEDKGILGTLKDIFVGDDEEYNYRDNYNNRDLYSNPYGSPRDPYYDNRGNDYSGYSNRGALPPQSYEPPRDPYRDRDYNNPRDPYADPSRDRRNDSRSTPRNNNPDRQDRSTYRDNNEDRYTRDERYPTRRDDNNYAPNSRREDDYPRRTPPTNNNVDRSRQRDDDYLDDAPQQPPQQRRDEDRNPPQPRQNNDPRSSNPSGRAVIPPDSRSMNSRPAPAPDRNPRTDVRRSSPQNNNLNPRSNPNNVQPIRDDWDDDDEWY
ncbi:molecular chaperone DnaK [Chamaesiphon minutus]|uniref:Chaperone protein DnaK n=1 Tax=Chamaesiphon minutus (strain ATCC 27169 / PCC 6605) TaxID=1173020 RepID=K9UGJ1_CHAP6|nr:molecular chaperone DnaK [Chamaesiphon minutus]AFY93935.1 chaperone protein DnaK [Chamaesiphon minutus PCC 6605]